MVDLKESWKVVDWLQQNSRRRAQAIRTWVFLLATATPGTGAIPLTRGEIAGELGISTGRSLVDHDGAGEIRCDQTAGGRARSPLFHERPVRHSTSGRLRKRSPVPDAPRDRTGSAVDTSRIDSDRSVPQRLVIRSLGI